MPVIRQLSRRTVYQNRWMKLHEDTIRFPDGTDGIYGVVDKEDFVLILPVHADASFQLVRQYRYPVAGRYWEFPQGSWETRPGTDPARVAAGELEEETGYRAEQLDKLGFLYPANGTANQGCHIFRATGLTPGRMAREPEEQDLETSRFTRAEIMAMIAGGDIRDAATVAALFLLDATA
ncbi:MAG TPA: ADP-ribose pyrophosphatase [Rhodobacteraceae bacterium]|nr:ADP-ribose pyrophosphatase [Paracoccaceae bacterium]